MGSELIYHTNGDIKPFIAFDVEIKPNQMVSCVGYEFICANPKCDCHEVHIGIHEVGSKKVLTYISYGWRDYEYYLSKGNSKSDAKGCIEGMIKDAKSETEQNQRILLGFRKWLSKDKAQNDQIFAERYKNFKDAVRNRQMSKAKNAKLQKCFSMMLELFGEERVEKFIAGLQQPGKVTHITDSKKGQ